MAQHAVEPFAKEPHLKPVPDEPTELTPKSREELLLDGFFGYCEQAGLDARTTETSKSRELAMAAHTFVARVIDRKVQTLTDDEKPINFYVIPRGTIQQHIRDYYQRFGTSRREKTGSLRDEEEQYVRDHQNPLYAVAYVGDGPEKKIPRILDFPEIGITMRLHNLLQDQENQVAADAVETVLVAYGDRFLTRITAVGQNAQRAYDEASNRRDNHGIIHPGS